MKVAIASCAEMPPGFGDDLLLATELAALGVEAEIRAWDDAAFDWTEPAAVVVRSTWDYTFALDAFRTWSDEIGERLHNSPELIAWNSDKHYLADLADAGVPTVTTTFVEPGESWAPGGGEVVVKPTVSAGARDTGRFTPSHHDQAVRLVATIAGSDRTAMVQPFQASVDSEGETALVFLDGEFSHGLRKRAVLAPDEIAPLAETGPRAAKAMYDPNLVGPGGAARDQLELAEVVIDRLVSRFGTRPLYARVDLLRDDDGEPVLLELEAVEPNLYFEHAEGAARRLAEAIVARVD